MPSGHALVTASTDDDVIEPANKDLQPTGTVPSENFR
jgi:hypothetical protein